MEVAHVELSTASPSECRHFDLFQLSFLQSLRFGASVLEPDFDLSFCEPQRRRELCAFGDAEVLLLAELLLQRQQLLSGEWRAWLPVWFVLTQKTFQSWRFSVCSKNSRN